jgi:glycosyltransferase involved in cell wall biosynthesis
MRVLLVSNDFHRAQGQLCRFVVSTAPAGVDFFLFAAKEIGKRPEEFKKILNNVDVVHWLMNLSNFDPNRYYFPGGFPCPSVASVHHVEPHEHGKIVHACRADVIHVMAREWQDYLKEKIPTPVIYSRGGVAPAILKGSPVRRPRTPFRIGTFGFPRTFQDRKRVDLLIKTLVLLKNKIPQPFCFIAQGEGWKEFSIHFAQAGIDFKYRGIVAAQEVWKSYSDIDLYLCSSTYEGGPLTIMEALAHEVPVVSTNVGLAKEILPQGGGTLCPVEDPDALSEALAEMITDSNFYKKCSAEGPGLIRRFMAKASEEYGHLYAKAVEVWQAKNKKIWDLAAVRNGLPAPAQRRRELTYDLLRESQYLMSHGHKKEALKLSWQAMNSGLVPLPQRAHHLAQSLKRVMGHV